MIYVFKTSVSSKELVHRLKSQLDKIFVDGKWNFDLEDSDNILRLDVSRVQRDETISYLKSQKIHCQELH
ncbi:hypothetical protein [Zunongwangia endophytica]|uniref:Uncharacterized protein n=1 Tax=Zunongwangia endophytica TaxID=1808945 RepID=A0ABV8HGB6_9FLAO|nr:hypothetical protein [Zunongwangia endophytica]MDN3596843.1 hypothetical protein [Zunongwangia endophytica]